MTFGSRNYLNVGPKGTFRKSGTYRSQPSDVDALFADLAAGSRSKLTIHFHGGLVDEAEGMKVAQKMMPVYDAAGAHPLTFVWETGPLETIRTNLDTIHRTELFQFLLRKLIEKVMERLGITVGGRGLGGRLSRAEIEAELAKPYPFDDVRFTSGARGGASMLSEPEADLARQEVAVELEQEFDADPDFARIMTTEAPVTKQLKKEEILPSAEEGARGLVSSAKAAIAVARIFYLIVTRFIQKRDHDLYPTVVEELLRSLYAESVGGWIWGGMKRNAQRMWADNAGLTGNDLHAGRYFLEQLARHQSAHPLTVDLVGHSAGSIAILEMMRARKAAAIPIDVRHTFFLAPACTSKLFYQCISNGEDAWRTFRMFTMDDSFEKLDRMLGVIYPYSLLYFVSGLIEDSTDEPILGMQRFLSGAAPFDEPHLLKVREYVQDTASARYAPAVWGKINAGALEGFRTSSESHGGFDDDADTLASLKYLIAQ